MKKWLGRFLIVTPLVLLFASSVAVKGWIETLVAWGLVGVFFGMIVGGIALLGDDA